MNYRLSAAMLVLATLAGSCRAQFANLESVSRDYASISFTDHATGQNTWAQLEHWSSDLGPWLDTVVVPLSIPIGHGTATAHVNAEALTAGRIGGDMSVSLSLTAANANTDAAGRASGIVGGAFTLLEPTLLHVEGSLSGNAGVVIYDYNFQNYVYERDGESNFPIVVSDTFLLGPGRWIVSGTAGASANFWGQAGSASPAASGSFVLTALCYPNCDASTEPPVLNVNDFACFLNKFAGHDAYANCDGSTTPPTLNVLDFACFLNRFAAGCP